VAGQQQSQAYQFTQSGTKVKGFAYGGVPRIGVCGSVTGSAVRLYFLPDSLLFTGTFQSAALVTGAIGGVGQATLTATQDALEGGGGYPNC
jgi:hypothetical protein